MDKVEYIGFMDLRSHAALHDTCLVLPSLNHAFHLWLYYREFAVEGHKSFYKTKTGVALRDTRTQLRLWVPYEREPTMPMDHERFRKGFVLVSPYPDVRR
jgi:hypothetical protein